MCACAKMVLALEEEEDLFVFNDTVWYSIGIAS